MMKDRNKVLIISCWIVLFVYTIIRLLGGNHFEIICTNERFINICNFIDSYKWLSVIVCTILYVPSTYLIYLSIVMKKLWNDKFVILVCLPISLLKDLIPIVGLILELIVMILIPLLKYGIKLWKRVLIGVLLVILFQATSMVLKNISFEINNEPLLVGIIMQLDYYIMIILYYLYSNRKEKANG